MVELTAADPGVDRVVALDTDAARAGDGVPPVASLVGEETAVERQSIDPLIDDLKTLFEGASTVLHLGWAATDEAEPGAASDTVEVARRVFDAAGGAGVNHLVVVSSATVYGAWPSSPIPLTEDAPIKPNPGFAPAVALAEVERLAAEWREDHPHATVAIVRPVTTLAPDRPSWLARALRAALAFPIEDHDPATQFVHLDDLASAIDIVRRSHTGGPINVAPDGWLEGPARRALDVRPRFRVPEPVAARLASWRWRLGVAPTPPEVIPYATYPWVVANDRLRALGWRPGHTNEEAWVEGHRAGPLATLSPRRRQELVLGGAATAVAGIAAGVVIALRRRRSDD